MGSQPTKSNIQDLNDEEFIELDDSDFYDERGINYEDFTFVWFDDTPIQSHIQNINPVTVSFDKTEECIEYIKNIRTEFVYLIVGRAALGKPFLKLPRSCPQLQAICVICVLQPDAFRRWHGATTFTNASALIETLKNDTKLSLNELTPMRVLKDKEDLEFVWYYLFLQLLRDIEPTSHSHKLQLYDKLTKFYKNMENEQKIIDAFRRNYNSQKTLWWFTENHRFICRTINKAFRVKNYPYLCSFRFFLRDLHNRMVELKPSVLSNEYTVYRMQRRNRFLPEKISIGSLIVIESFIFTTIDRPETDGIIIEIAVKKQTSQLFAPLNKRGDLVFYPMCVFRLETYEGKFIRLVMDENVDAEINRMINNAIGKYNLHYTNTIQMGFDLVRLNIGTIQQIYCYFRMLIDTIPPKDCLELANVHFSLAGYLKQNRRYRRALIHYEIAEELYLKTVPHNHLYLSPTYKHLAAVHRLKRQYNQSLEYNLKALDIRELSLPKTHVDIGESLVDIALSYYYLGLNEQSMQLLDKAKDIFELNQLPDDDPRCIQLEKTYKLCRKGIVFLKLK